TEFTISVEEEESTEEENTEFITSVKEEKPTVVEEPKMLVIGNDFFSMTESNHQIVEEEDKEEKKQEFKTHHDSLSQLSSPCPKLPPPPFLSIMSSQVPTPKSPETNLHSCLQANRSSSITTETTTVGVTVHQPNSVAAANTTKLTY
ncbi:hypothetical protein A2U01_0042883, partial [Trifolium medium]|nr:hypothetical protein [Trifolium medium]